MVDPLTAHLLRMADPAALADAVGMVPDAWQTGVLRSGHPRILMNCGRQSGKSEVAALLCVHTALFEPGSVVLLLSPSMRQSSLLMHRVLSIYRSLGRPVVATSEQALSLTLENGSKVVALPGTENTVRGYSKVALLVVDEASRVDDSLIAAIRPMLAISSGRLVALSTPAGQRGWWYQAWSGDDDWLRVKVTAAQNPRIPAEWLQSERAMLGEAIYAQEYACEFLGAGPEQVFRAEDIKAAFRRDIEPSMEIKWKETS